MESELISHRSPSPLFQPDFDALEGYIYHLHDGPGPTAYKLLKQDWYDEFGNSNGLDKNIEFRDEFKSAVVYLIEALLFSSNKERILFTSDYQFGPENVTRHGLVSISEFWKLHDEGKLRMNASYLITKS